MHGDAGGHQPRHDGRWAGHWDDRMASLDCGPNERIPRIGDTGHTGVGDDGHIARVQTLGQPCHFAVPREGVEARGRSLDVVVLEQHA